MPIRDDSGGPWQDDHSWLDALRVSNWPGYAQRAGSAARNALSNTAHGLSVISTEDEHGQDANLHFQVPPMISGLYGSASRLGENSWTPWTHAPVDPHDFDTAIDPSQENAFREWENLNAPNDSGEDYDLRGAFLGGVSNDPSSGHWPDTFKKPNHPTFSNESQYAAQRPDLAGHWEGEQYVPPASFGIPNPQHPQNQQDAASILMAISGGNALGRGPRAAAAAPQHTGMVSAAQGAEYPQPIRAYRGASSVDDLLKDGAKDFYASASPNVAGTYADITANGFGPGAFEDGAMMPVDMTFKNPMTIDAGGHRWSRIPESDGSFSSTNGLAMLASRRGHDGLIVQNVIDDMTNTGQPSTTYAALQRGTVTSPLTGETLFSDNRPSLMGSALAGAEHPQPIRAYRGANFNSGLTPDKNTPFFSSSSPEVASSYADGSGSGAVMPMDLKFLNPMTVDAGGNLWNRIPYEGFHLETNDLLYKARDAGHDGLIVKNVIDDSNESLKPATTYAALKHGTVTSPLTGETLFSDNRPSLMGSALATAGRDLDPLGYYSGALEAAKNLRQAKGTPEQMLAMLKKEGAKQGEIDATGLGGFLDGKQSVTKDEIVNHLAQNRVGVNSASYRPERTNAELDLASQRLADAFEQEYPGLDRRTLDDMAERYRWQGVQRDDDALGVRSSIRDMSSPRIQGMIDDLSGAQAKAKWSAYSLDPSNPTYRETVLHLPKNNLTGAERAELDALNAKMRDVKANVRSEDFSRRQELDNKNNEVLFGSGHFSEPNIIGHMMTSMTEHEGRPVFTVDQIQSDWGQKLRDGGVRDEAKIAELRQRWTDAEAELKDLMERHKDEPYGEYEQIPYGMDRPIPKSAEAANNRAMMLHAELRTAEASTPGHPLVNTTDQWTNTTLRHALRQAAEANADHIAIPSGDTVLGYNPGDAHGMNTFYNDIVPKNLGNILKKIDRNAATPRQVNALSTPNNPAAGKGFSLFDLSPETRQKILDDGFPLFSGGSHIPNALSQNHSQDLTTEDILKIYGL